MLSCLLCLLTLFIEIEDKRTRATRSKVRSGMRINIRPLGNCGENGCAKASQVFPESRIIVTESARKYLVMKTTLY